MWSSRIGAVPGVGDSLQVRWLPVVSGAEGVAVSVLPFFAGDVCRRCRRTGGRRGGVRVFAVGDGRPPEPWRLGVRDLLHSCHFRYGLHALSSAACGAGVRCHWLAGCAGSAGCAAVLCDAFHSTATESQILILTGRSLFILRQFAVSVCGWSAVKWALRGRTLGGHPLCGRSRPRCPADSESGGGQWERRLRAHLKTRGDRRVTGEEWVNSW